MPEKCILVIDDEVRLSAVVQVCLENLGGWNVVVAQSGKEGLIKAETNRPDAILLDVMMPDMDGLTLFQRLQESPTTQTIPVILLTAKAQTSDHAQFMQLGVVGVITKPFDPMTLSEQIATMLDWH